MAQSILFGPGQKPTPERANRLISFVQSYLDGCSGLPQPIQASRTSAVFHLAEPGSDQGLCVKAYTYKRFRQVVRGFHRNTFLGPSRAKREWINLQRLRRIGIATPDPVAIIHLRHWRALRAAAVVTGWIEDAPALDVYLARATPAQRRRVLCETARITARMHAAGYTDGDLHPRNLLVRSTRDGGTCQVYKIDSPAGRARAPLRRRRHDLACLEVAGRRLLNRSERLRFFRHYSSAVQTRPLERCWLAAIAKRADELEAKEGPRVDEALARAGVGPIH